MILSGCYHHINYGPRNIPLRKMVEKHLSVADGVVKMNVSVYRVVHHQWPELLAIKNMNDRRSITKLIYRTKAVLYGNQCVERMIMADVNDVLAKTTD
jgi:hypothetical protein